MPFIVLLAILPRALATISAVGTVVGFLVFLFFYMTGWMGALVVGVIIAAIVVPPLMSGELFRREPTLDDILAEPLPKQDAHTPAGELRADPATRWR